MIETTDEALNYCRHLTNNEIRLMTLQRIINRDPLNQGIPASFVSIYTAWPPERQKEMLENFPLFCPKCKHETLIAVRQLNLFIVQEPDAKTQSR